MINNRIGTDSDKKDKGIYHFNSKKESFQKK